MPSAPLAGSRDRRVDRFWGSVLLLLPLAAFLLMVFVVPLAMLLKLSFGGAGGPFSAYSEIASSEVYRKVFLNTFTLAITVASCTVLLSYPTAYMLSQLSGWKRSVAFWCLFFPLWISVLVRTFSWIVILEKSGPVNRALLGMGLTSSPLSLLFNSFGVHVGMVHVLLPYALLPIFTSMKAVDRRLLLASDSLGASPLTTFGRIYFPLTLPGLSTGFVLVFLMALGFYITPAMLGAAQHMTISMLIDNFVNERLAWPLAAAASFSLLFVIVALVASANRLVNFVSAMAAR
ncbi:ABC transporter permease [Bradyrhizobium genomosp. I (2014)]|uniref:ABC transporter permease n=1 Tax=Bradyrhizobium genomosp. I (2014) TaxID=2683269 RepID=UPI000553982E|nr:ABC transporter permease [Bradyrhizobium sp. CCBAU 43298]